MKLRLSCLVAVTLPAEPSHWLESVFHFFCYVSHGVKMPSFDCPFKKGGLLWSLGLRVIPFGRKVLIHLTDLDMMFIVLESCFVLIRVPKADKRRIHTY